MKLAVFPDFAEEGWASMDLVAEMLMDGLKAFPEIQAERVIPEYVRRATRVPIFGAKPIAANVDRLLNRMRYFPQYARSRNCEFDFFHIVDHSYSQLVHELPSDRTGVFCHDLDTFRCVLEPEREPRPKWFLRMVGRIIAGLRRAAVVFHTTDTIREQILRAKLVDAKRLVKAPYGMAEEFRLGTNPEVLPAEVGSRIGKGPMMLHVGSCIPRKRIDVLLDVFAEVRGRVPEAWLVQAGGEWTVEQQSQIERLNLADGIVRTGRQPRPVIAELYRQARVVLMPSEAEGFGLPVAEAMACGAIVVTSDIPVFREVGGSASVYAPLADVNAWVDTIESLLDHPETAPARDIRLSRASRYTWTAHVRAIVDAYKTFA